MTGLEPLIIAAVIAGTAVTAYGQYQQGKTAQSQAKAQAAWNMYNAKVAEREAEAEKAATASDVKQHKRKAAALLAKQRAMVGKSGVEMVGSPLLVAEDTAAELAKEETNIRLRGQRKAMAFEGQSILDVSKASAAKSRAAGYGQAAILNAGGTLLQGGAQAGYMSHQMKA